MVLKNALTNKIFWNLGLSIKNELNFSSIIKAQQCYCHFSFRSVTLVGEKGRKILKEVVKQAKVPPKSICDREIQREDKVV